MSESPPVILSHDGSPPTSVMRIGLVAETVKAETRVALTPDAVRKVVSLGYTVDVESGAGERAGFDDAAYLDAGAKISTSPVWDADVVVMINAPQPDEIPALRPGGVVIAMLAPALDPERLAALAARGGSRRWRWTRFRGFRELSRWTC